MFIFKVSTSRKWSFGKIIHTHTHKKIKVGLLIVYDGVIMNLNAKFYASAKTERIYIVQMTHTGADTS